jgi:hypothetical protein
MPPESRVRTWGRRAIKVAALVLDILPLTWLGVLSGVLSYTAITRYANAQMDIVLLVVGWGVAALLALATLLVAFSTVAVALIVRREHSTAPPTTETGVVLPTGRTLPTLAFVPLVSVDVAWEAPLGAVASLGEGVFRKPERARFDARGIFGAVTRVITVADVFGLARIRVRVRETRASRVIPHMGGLRSLPTLRSMSSGDAISHPLGLDEGDRSDLRRYTAGDSARFVHWKIFARSRRLMVRVPERAISPVRRIVAYYVSGPADEASAGAARAALELGAFGSDWVFSASGANDSVKSVPEAVDRIVRSASHRDDAGGAIDRFLADADRSGPSSLVLFVPSLPGPWIANVARVLRDRKSGARVVIGVDGIMPHEPSLLRRLLTNPPTAKGVPPLELEKVVAALEATRAEIVVIDRGSGRVLRAPGAKRALMQREAAA